MKLSMIYGLGALILVSGSGAANASSAANATTPAPNEAQQDLPVIGLDKNGQATQQLVNEADFTQRLQALVQTTNDSVLPVMKKHENTSVGWAIRTFLVGVGVNATIDIGVWGLTVNPKTRMTFTNSNNPTLP